MVHNFLIDRQFGVAIWIDVENGIVQNCYNESEKFINRMNELYVGKTITFLKNDYLEKMSGTIQIFHPVAVINLLQKIRSAETRIRHMYNEISRIRYTPQGQIYEISTAEKKLILDKIKETEKELYDYQIELKNVLNEIETIHAYDCENYRKNI